MSQSKDTNVKRLSTPTVTGLILVLLPVNTCIIMSIYSLFRKNEYTVVPSIDGPSTVYLESVLPDYVPVIGLGMFIVGLLVLGFMAFRKFMGMREKNANPGRRSESA
ncbi:MAG: hypothetical protein JW712_04985 [Dehalococcoidales bacterium]|nr:hypothetical protein [Dehalococcoidales bacterium]